MTEIFLNADGCREAQLKQTIICISHIYNICLDTKSLLMSTLARQETESHPVCLELK